MVDLTPLILILQHSCIKLQFPTAKLQTEMDESLYRAAIEGDAGSLITLIQQDPLILDRRNTVTLETPLHIAAMLGHEEFTAELLRRKPRLARELDSRKSSPLHLASAGGHVEVVKMLLQTDPDMCSVCDRDGRNPVQIAAMMGRMEVLGEMLVVGADADAARAVMKRGGTILHLCVEYSQFEALKLVVENFDLKDLVNGRDRDGNSVLHLAVAHKQVEMVEFLLQLPGVDLQAVNLSGITATDILMQRRIDVRDLQIQETLKHAGAIRADQCIQPTSLYLNRLNPEVLHHSYNQIPKTKRSNNQTDWLERQRSALMVVASLIATMAFQSAVSPPAKLWPNADDQTANPPAPSPSNDAVRDPMYYVRKAGNYLKNGERFYTINTTSFIASLSIILLLMSGLPLNNKVVMWILMTITWVAISDIALSYTVTVILQTPSENEKSVYTLVAITVFSWICLVSFLVIGHTLRLFAKMVGILVRPFSVRRRKHHASLV